MTDNAPAVALLFDDAELGAQLRAVLSERGARIVHEGGVATLDEAHLRQAGADVVVVNLDDTDDAATDLVCALAAGEHPRVVFNDAQASRGLDGWDRERWARHLAVKVLQHGDLDPPRPADAREIDPPRPSDEPTHLADEPPVETPITAEDLLAPAAMAAIDADDADMLAGEALVVDDDQDLQQRFEHDNSESENLAAELEALLSAPDSGLETDAAPAVDADPAATLEAELSAMDFEVPSTSEPVAVAKDAPAAAEPDPFADLVIPDDVLAEVPQSAGIGAAPAAGLDELLARDVGDALLDAPDAAGTDTAASATVSAPSNWALLDPDAPPSAILPPDPAHSGTFGVQKLSAAEFLAPDVEPVAHGYEPTLSLELVSMEEAVAPKPMGPAHEMHLDELHMALSRLVLTGAASEGAAAAAAFYAALPPALRVSFVHTQHLGRGQIDDVVDNLARACALPVRLAATADVARPGEVLVVPRGQRLRLHRDGRVELTVDADMPEASIDDSFTMAAENFGRDAIGIVFRGQGVDAVAGAQAIHDRGGSVWVEAGSTDYADMVSGISAEHLDSYSGSPQELAAHLIEVFP